MRYSQRPEWACSQRYRPPPLQVTHPCRKDTVLLDREKAKQSQIVEISLCQRAHWPRDLAVGPDR